MEDAVRADREREVIAGRDGPSGAQPRRHRGLPVARVAPARHRPVRSDRDDVVPAEGDRRGRAERGRDRCLAVRIVAPDADLAIQSDRRGVEAVRRDGDRRAEVRGDGALAVAVRAPRTHEPAEAEGDRVALAGGDREHRAEVGGDGDLPVTGVSPGPDLAEDGVLVADVARAVTVAVGLRLVAHERAVVRPVGQRVVVVVRVDVVADAVGIGVGGLRRVVRERVLCVGHAVVVVVGIVAVAGAVRIRVVGAVDGEVHELHAPDVVRAIRVGARPGERREEHLAVRDHPVERGRAERQGARLGRAVWAAEVGQRHALDGHPDELGAAAAPEVRDRGGDDADGTRRLREAGRGERRRGGPAVGDQLLRSGRRAWAPAASRRPGDRRAEVGAVGDAVVVVVRVRVVAGAVAVAVGGLRRVERERVGRVGHAVVVVVGVARISRPVAVRVLLAGVGRRRAVVLRVGEPVRVVVGVGVVADAVAVRVGALRGVERERVLAVRHAVVVVIGVEAVGRPVRVGVDGPAVRPAPAARIGRAAAALRAAGHRGTGIGMVEHAVAVGVDGRHRVDTVERQAAGPRADVAVRAVAVAEPHRAVNRGVARERERRGEVDRADARGPGDARGAVRPGVALGRREAREPAALQQATARERLHVDVDADVVGVGVGRGRVQRDVHRRAGQRADEHLAGVGDEPIEAERLEGDAGELHRDVRVRGRRRRPEGRCQQHRRQRRGDG